MIEESNKEIVVLSEKEHILQRSSLYVGSVKPALEKVPIIKNKNILVEEKKISIGMYKILNEAIDNAVDEAKRMKGSMEKIEIRVNSKTNAISVRDYGNGFYKGTSINKFTGKTNIETAVAQLRSGTNFSNENSDETLIGVNGLGIKLLNIFSKRFKIITVNDTHYFEKEWIDFESDDTKTVIRKKNAKDIKGTLIEAFPLNSIFGNYKWDKEILESSLMMKNRLIKKDPLIKNLNIIFYWDEIIIDLPFDFFPDNSCSIETPIGEVVIWEKSENSGSFSFINSALCTGIHQKIINDFINEKLGDTLGHHFYETYISLNLPPKLVTFRDQNKTRLDTTREELEGTISKNILVKLSSFFKTELFQSILKKVEERREEGHIKKLRAEKRKINVKISNKYFPASKNSAENLFVVEGDSAKGSILQKRDPQNDGVYALKGKIKNCRNLSDLSDNKEILELMQILNLDPTIKGVQMISSYRRVVIATDPDPDGSHITSLIINLFYKWFPFVIKNKQLNLLRTPLVSIGESKKRKYFYDLDEFKNAKSGNSGIRYLKGLGSLDLNDWEYVMGNKNLVEIQSPEESKKFLEMAFGDDSSLRKKWLAGGGV